MMDILFILGTRPEAIKLAPLIQLCKHHQQDVAVCVTSQHQELLKEALSYFNLVPDFNLNVMTHNQSLSHLSAALMPCLSDVLSKTKPKWVVVQGDTTSAFMGALAAFYHHIPVAHIEAGLRSSNPYSPFPEEMNRTLISSLATCHFAPTPKAKQHLKKQGITSHVWVCGNTVIDALMSVQKDIKKNQSHYDAFFHPYSFSDRIVLITAHRRENFGHHFQNICKAINALCQAFPEVSFVFPRHPNPHIQSQSDATLKKSPNLFLMPPLSYPYFIALMQKSELIISDSGGIQEEAPALGKPLLITRADTERQEGLSKNAKLVGSSQEEIIKYASLLLHKDDLYLDMSKVRFPYGKGHSSEFIFSVMQDQLKKDSFNNG